MGWGGGRVEGMGVGKGEHMFAWRCRWVGWEWASNHSSRDFGINFEGFVLDRQLACMHAGWLQSCLTL